MGTGIGYLNSVIVFFTIAVTHTLSAVIRVLLLYSFGGFLDQLAIETTWLTGLYICPRVERK